MAPDPYGDRRARRYIQRVLMSGAIAVVAVVATLTDAESSLANHQPGASYSGVIEGGHPLALTVKAGGSEAWFIIPSWADGVPGDSCKFRGVTIDVPILSDHSLLHAGASTVRGTFPDEVSATGTVVLRSPGGCETAELRWHAIIQGTRPIASSPVPNASYEGAINVVGDCGGGTILLSVSEDGESLRSVQVTDLRIHDKVHSGTVTFSPGAVPVNEGVIAGVYFSVAPGEEVHVQGRFGGGFILGGVVAAPTCQFTSFVAEIVESPEVSEPDVLLPPTGSGQPRANASQPWAWLLPGLMAVPVLVLVAGWWRKMRKKPRA